MYIKHVKTTSLSVKLIAFLGSPKFFWGIVILFVLESLWIALSAAYPMAFDENYHFGIIKLYAEHLSPFWQSAPSNSDAFGVVHRDTSYMYQYLMSYPYNLVAWFTNSQTIQVIWLRLINISMFVAGLIIYRQLLAKTGASRAIVNSCILVFVLIPVVPLLAAHINYDNLFIPLVGLSLLLTINLAKNIKDRNNRVLFELLTLVTLCLFISIIKYAFVPFFLAIIIYILIIAFIEYKNLTIAWLELKRGSLLIKRPIGIALIILLAVMSVLFVERYIVNTVKYHTPVPECSAVLSEQSCSKYGPWSRDNKLAQNKPVGSYNPVKFNVEWFEGMWMRLYFSLGGPDTGYQTRKPMPVPYTSSIIFASVGTVLAILLAPRIWRKYEHRVLNLFVGVTGLYVVILWIDQYQAYIKTGQPVAINGRYLLPIMMLIMVIMVFGFNELLRHHNNFKIGILGFYILCLLYGGGAMTFILRSNSTWYWNNNMVISVNETIQRNLGPLYLGYPQK